MRLVLIFFKKYHFKNFVLHNFFIIIKKKNLIDFFDNKYH